MSRESNVAPRAASSVARKSLPAGAANNFTETPTSPEFGQLIAAQEPENTAISRVEDDAAARFSDHEASDGELMQLDELLSKAIGHRKRGRPAVFDELAKGKLIALLALGLSLRQAASLLGVSHSTVSNALKTEPALAEEITAARFQAQVQPLACIMRESRRSWKAATWLLKYLDTKMRSYEETPQEQSARLRQEREDMVAQAKARR